MQYGRGQEEVFVTRGSPGLIPSPHGSLPVSFLLLTNPPGVNHGAPS